MENRERNGWSKEGQSSQAPVAVHTHIARNFQFDTLITLKVQHSEKRTGARSQIAATYALNLFAGIIAQTSPYKHISCTCWQQSSGTSYGFTSCSRGAAHQFAVSRFRFWLVTKDSARPDTGYSLTSDNYFKRHNKFHAWPLSVA